METVKAAKVQERGQNLVMVPVSRRYDRLTEDERRVFLRDATASASADGIDGAVCVVWESGPRDMYLGPRSLREYYERISFRFALANATVPLSLAAPAWFSE